ncbi:MAG TPA: hypothetical protein VGN34_07355 [Ktedonobacteraceae bacterium]
MAAASVPAGTADIAVDRAAGTVAWEVAHMDLPGMDTGADNIFVPEDIFLMAAVA